MFWKKNGKDKKNLRNLSEKEIQRQLYGDILKKGEYRVEVMDSAAIFKEKGERPIEEKFDAKIKKEVNEEIHNLQNEFKLLKNEVNRLRREKEALERSDFWFRPPFLKAKHLIVIGSIVVLLAFVITCLVAVNFIIKEIKPGGRQTIGSKSSSSLGKKKVSTKSKKELIPVKKKQPKRPRN